MQQTAGRKHRTAVTNVHVAWVLGEYPRPAQLPAPHGPGTCIAYDLESLRWRAATVHRFLRRSRLEDFPRIAVVSWAGDANAREVYLPATHVISG